MQEKRNNTKEKNVEEREPMIKEPKQQNQIKPKQTKKNQPVAFCQTHKVKVSANEGASLTTTHVNWELSYSIHSAYNH